MRTSILEKHVASISGGELFPLVAGLLMAGIGFWPSTAPGKGQSNGPPPPGRPQVAEALLNDANGNGQADPDEPLTLIMTRSVIVTTQALSQTSFYLHVYEDDLGGQGFHVDIQPFNSRDIVLNLGSNPVLCVPGEFFTTRTMSGYPSGIDLSVSLPGGSIQSLMGQWAIDGGEPNVNDSGVDIRYTCVASSATIDSMGGSVQVLQTPNAAYTKHRLVVPAEAVTDSRVFTLRPAEKTFGVVSAVQIVVEDAPSPAPGPPGPGATSGPRDSQTTFGVPLILTMQYRDSDVDVELGQSEAGMRICQLVEGPLGEFKWKVIPGQQTVDTTSKTVTVMLSSLTMPLSMPMSGSGPGPCAVLPGSTVEPETAYIKPQPGAQAVIEPGPGGDYTLHRIEIPNFVETASTDPLRISVMISPTTLAQRSSSGGQSFPSQSSAIFAIETLDAGGLPIAFAAPVDIRVQFMDGTQNEYNDLVDFGGNSGPPIKMRVVLDVLDGPPVDFDFITSVSQTVDLTSKTVQADGVTSLTGASGVGVWGAVVDPSAGAYGPSVREWKRYE